MENLEEIVKERNRAYFQLEVGTTGTFSKSLPTKTSWFNCKRRGEISQIKMFDPNLMKHYGYRDFSSSFSLPVVLNKNMITL